MAEGHRGLAMPLSRRLVSDRATSPGPLLRTTDSSCASVGVGCYLADGLATGALLAGSLASAADESAGVDAPGSYGALALGWDG
jgi:hypothetical protein